MSEIAYFARISQELLEIHDEQAAVEEICRRALEVVEPVACASVTVRRRRGRLQTLASTHPRAARADALQHELGQGPCLETALTGMPFLVSSTAEDGRWPRWGRSVAEQGIGSMLSVELAATALDEGQDPLGALNLYADRALAFTERDVERALVFGVHAANALAVARLVTTLGEAIEARHHVGLAQGVLVHRHGIDPDTAFERLRDFSSQRNLKLREVASHVVAEGELPEEPETTGMSEV